MNLILKSLELRKVELEPGSPVLDVYQDGFYMGFVEVPGNRPGDPDRWVAWPHWPRDATPEQIRARLSDYHPNLYRAVRDVLRRGMPFMPIHPGLFH